MRKLNYTGKICVVLCAILCVGSLSGCGAAMQSLTDGADAVLNGLADGTDIVLNGLSEGADQVLGGLSEADDGQAKDSIVKAFGELLAMREMRPLRPKVNYRVTKKTEQTITRETMKQHIPSLRAQKFYLAVLHWSEKLEVRSASPVYFLLKAAKQQFFFAQGQMIRSFFSRRAVSTMER